MASFQIRDSVRWQGLMADSEVAESGVAATAELVPNGGLARGIAAILFLSMLALAAAPMLVGDSYSLVDHTLSESGGQGVDGGWLFRTGVVLAATAVFLLTFAAGALWPAVSKWLLRAYSLALLGATWFSESPWDERPHDETEAFLHTVFTVSAATAFILGVLTISRQRPKGHRWVRVFDWLVVLAIALLPQVMLVTDGDGVLQRILVVLGYGWLFAEAIRVARAPEGIARVQR